MSWRCSDVYLLGGCGHTYDGGDMVNEIKIIDVTDKLEINYASRERINGRAAWCEMPYPGHKKGCPNYDKCLTLPRIENYFDLDKPHWFAIVTFDLQAHINRMRYLHPTWSDRQCRCVLYWQNGVKSQLDRFCVNWIKLITPGENMIYHKIPEAMGVNVILTMKRIGQYIETKPKSIVKKVALIGERKTW